MTFSIHFLRSTPNDKTQLHIFKQATYLDARGHRLELDAGVDAPDEVGPMDGQSLQVEEGLLVALGRCHRVPVLASIRAGTGIICSYSRIGIRRRRGQRGGCGHGEGRRAPALAEGRGGEARQHLDDSRGSSGLLPKIGDGRRGQGAQLGEEGAGRAGRRVWGGWSWLVSHRSCTCYGCMLRWRLAGLAGGTIEYVRLRLWPTYRTYAARQCRRRCKPSLCQAAAERRNGYCRYRMASSRPISAKI